MQQPQHEPNPDVRATTPWAPQELPEDAPPRPEGGNSEWVLVTPDLAANWLSRNKRNRPMLSLRVAFYVHQLETGQWNMANPQPIIFDTDGLLDDGQHRLEAVILSGCATWFRVVWDAPPSVRPVLDTGKSRTPMDLLAMQHGLSPAQAQVGAAAARVLLMLEADPEYPFRQYQAKRLTNTEVERGWVRWRDLIEQTVPLAIAVNDAGVRGGRGLWCGLLCRFSEIDSEDAILFATAVITGADLAQGDPRLLLRHRLTRELVNVPNIRNDTYGRLIAAAWNSWRRREMRKILRVDLSVPFPKLV